MFFMCSAEKGGGGIPTSSRSGQGEVEGRRPRGGPRASWRDTIREWSRGG